MFRKQPLKISEVVCRNLRHNGLETPLRQMRLLAAWDKVVGPGLARYTVNKFIRNQTLFVQLSSPALRSELSMHRRNLIARLNEAVGAFVIAEIKFY